MADLYLEDKTFGDLLDFVKNDDITDINWNGSELWIDDLKKGRYKHDIILSTSFVEQFAVLVSNLMNQNFNQYYPILEAETDVLRLSFVHESVTNTGTSLSIRKTPPERRLSYDKMIKEHYCTEDLDTFMRNAVKSHLNIIVAGLPGVGKTEYVKMLTDYIPASERVITIEDTLEIRYRQINPGKDCVELRVGPTFSYSDAIKACLRQFPTWILLSEARGEEVIDLLQSLSTGTYCISTIHTNDAMKIPNRILNMMNGKISTALENDIYSFIDVGILIKAEDIPGEGKQRKIAQVVLYSHENGRNISVPFYEDGSFNLDAIPDDIMKKFKDAKINDIFAK